jgi:hypothetical protein
MRIWCSYVDADKAAEILNNVFFNTGKLPDVLVSDIRLSLYHSYPGVPQHFYSKLNPETLKAFSESNNSKKD